MRVAGRSPGSRSLSRSAFPNAGVAFSGFVDRGRPLTVAGAAAALGQSPAPHSRFTSLARGTDDETRQSHRNRRRNPNPLAVFPENYCADNNNQIMIGKENYLMTYDGFLMPVKKDQPPPDLRYFKQTGK